MNETLENEFERDAPATDFYLPATAPGPDLGRVEAFLEELFDLHGVVLVPDTYNQ